MASHLAMDKVLAVQQSHAAGRSRRDIARTLGIGRKTVDRVLRGKAPLRGPFIPHAPIGADTSKEAKAPIGSHAAESTVAPTAET